MHCIIGQMAPKKLKLVFVLDPLQKLSWSDDTSCSIIAEACKRNYDTFALEMENTFLKNSEVLASVKKIQIAAPAGICILEEIKEFKLAGADVIFVRKEPPFDSEYLYLTQLLELIKNETFILNSPSGLRETNEKLSILEFPEFITSTFVSPNPALILQFARGLGERIIVKPLDQKGGQGIHRFDPKQTDLEENLRRVTQNGSKTIMAQKYISAVEKTGDVRVLLLGGKILGAFTRVPPEGKFIANMDQGGVAVKHALTAVEEKISETVGQKLLTKGHHFVGIDIIGERLTEINVTSPAGIFEIDQLHGTRTSRQVVDYLEKQVR